MDAVDGGEARVQHDGLDLGVADGDVVEERTGARLRTRYSITRGGRRALRRWLAAPSAAPQFECEALVRSMFADHGTKDDLLRTLRELEEQASAARTQLLDQAADYLDTGGPFPHRLHLIALNGRFLLAFTKLLQDWAQWADAEVRTWPDTTSLQGHAAAMATFRKVMGDDAISEIAGGATPSATARRHATSPAPH